MHYITLLPMKNENDLLSGDALVNYYCLSLGIDGSREKTLRNSMNSLLKQDETSLVLASAESINWAFFSSLHELVKKNSKPISRRFLPIFRKSPFLERGMNITFMHTPVSEMLPDGTRQNVDYYHILYANNSKETTGVFSLRSTEPHKYTLISKENSESVMHNLNVTYLNPLIEELLDGQTKITRGQVPGHIELYQSSEK